jgi:hypothetical protein
MPTEAGAIHRFSTTPNNFGTYRLTECPFGRTVAAIGR